MSKDTENKDLESLQMDEDFGDSWDLDDEDFVDIDLDLDTDEEGTPEEIFERPVRKVERVADDPYADHDSIEDVTSGRYRRKTEDSSRSRSGARGKNNGHFSGGGKSYLILILVCLAVIAVIMVVLKMASNSTSAAPESTTESTVQETTVAWEENANTAVSDLINQYYTARVASDMTTLQNVLDPSVILDDSRVQAEAQVIEAYQNINCYTTDGMNPGEYVVYISFNMKFKDIPTAAPGLVPAYVRPDANGALKLIVWDTAKNDAEMSAFMGKVANCDVIRHLAEEVNSAYQTAYSSDAQLAAFLDSLNGTSTAETTAADPNSTTAADPNATTAADPNATTAADPNATTAADPNATTAADPNAATAAADPNATTAAETTAAASTADFEERDSMEYVTENVKCRVQPNTDDSTDFTLVEGGARVHVIGSNGEWYHVYLEDGTEGYIKAEFVTPDNPNAAE